MKRAVTMAALALGAGCSVPLAAPVGQGPANVCSTRHDCADGATCAQGICVATRYDLTGLLLSVRPHADASFGAGTVYVIDAGAAGVQLVSAASNTEPFVTGFTFGLDEPVAISGRVQVDPSTTLPSGCIGPDRSVPAQITFFRVPRFAGLPFDSAHVSTIETKTANGTKHTFSATLVSDKGDLYDVYIEPQAGTGCAFPPYYLPGQAIDSSNTGWQLPPNEALSGSISGLDDPSTWQVDIVEPSRGLPISASSSLLAIIGKPGATVSAQVSPVDPSVSPILRLTPIAPTPSNPQAVDPTRATVYWQLDSLSSPVGFTVDDLAVDPVMVQGTIYGPDEHTVVASQLIIQSQTLGMGSNADNAAFSTNTAATDQGGMFTVGLPPGDYSIRASPVGENDFSITDYTLMWPPNVPTNTCVCALPIPLDTKATLTTSVTVPTGQPLATSAVGVTASQMPARPYLADTHKLPPLPVRPVATTTDDSGSFFLRVDRGLSDLTIQPDPATNLPWLVVPQIPPGTKLEPLTLKSPALLIGQIHDPEQMPVAGAEIDAWLPVKAASNPAVLIVVKIASTSTDATGAYTLVLPSSL